MQENQEIPIDPEEIVHENPVLKLPFDSPLAHAVITAIACAVLFSLPALAELYGV